MAKRSGVSRCSTTSANRGQQWYHPILVNTTSWLTIRYVDNDDEPDWLRQFQVTNRVEQRQQELIRERRQALRDRIRHIRQGIKVDKSSSAQDLARKRQRKASNLIK